MTFIDNPDNLPEVNHKDFDRLNNFVSNLEWCNHYDNIKHSRDAGSYDCIYKQTKKHMYLQMCLMVNLLLL